MDGAKETCAALRRAFAKARTAAGSAAKVRYSAALKLMAVQAVDDGVPVKDVRAAAGVAQTTLTTWLKRMKRRTERRSGAAGEPRFRRLKVQAPRATAVSMFVGRDIRLEFPPELLSAELIRQLAEDPS